MSSNNDESDENRPSKVDLLVNGFHRVTNSVLIPIALCLLVFSWFINDMFLLKEGVDNKNRITATNESNRNTIFPLQEYFHSSELQVCEWEFTVTQNTSSAGANITFSIVTENDNTYNGTTMSPVTPPFYTISNNFQNINGYMKYSTHFPTFNVGHKITLRMDTAKRRLTYYLNNSVSTEKILTNNLVIGNNIKYKMVINIPNGISVELSDFRHTFYATQPSIVITPSKEEATRDKCVIFNAKCMCHNVRFNEWSSYLLHATEELDDNWQTCAMCEDEFSFSRTGTFSRKLHRVVHDFGDNGATPFKCGCLIDGLKCIYETDNPNSLCKHINTVHYKGETRITPLQEGDINVSNIPRVENATEANTYVWDEKCPNCDIQCNSEAAYKSALKTCFWETKTESKNGKAGYRCSLMLKNGNICNRQFSLGTFINHLAANVHMVEPRKPLKCIVKTHGITCNHTEKSKKPMQRHINSHYGGGSEKPFKLVKTVRKKNK